VLVPSAIAAVITTIFRDRLAEYGLISGQPGSRLLQRDASGLVEATARVPFDLVLLRGGESLPLRRDDVDQTRARHLTDVAEGLDEIIDIVAVHRPHVAKSELFEQHPRNEHPLHGIVGTNGKLLHDLAHRAESRRAVNQLLQLLTHPVVEGARANGGEILVQRSHVRRDGHLVVVQHHDHIAVRMTRVVERLEREPARHRAIADDRHHFVLLAEEVASCRHPARGRDRGRSVTRTERVVLRLVPLQKAGKPVLPADGWERFVAAGQDLVRIRLVTDIPNQEVGRCLEDPMKCNRQLHRAQIGAEVRALVARNNVHDPVPDLDCEILQSVGRECPNVGGRSDRLEKRHVGYSFKHRTELRGGTLGRPGSMTGDLVPSAPARISDG
jgi:hypothetical protein